MADDKKYLRTVLGECRRGLSATYVPSVSRQVQLRVLESSFYQAAPALVLYAAKDNEVSTDLLLSDALASQRLVLMPKVISELHQLGFVRITNCAELKPGAFGILEPAAEEIMSAAEIGPALFCIPGVAFSRCGQRLGRGGGYFDRALAAIGPQTVTAGLAYSFQVLDGLPQAPNDRRLNLIITESAIHAGHCFDGAAPMV
ncbi:MAG: 5-formyltetrahydrofolate cyclo-ligase [Deltaproteobacteria bacterium]|nr:5-formyltetrahydrofolate cyclo-ligase [Deltaproteobacteria bacterium]